VSYSFGNFKFLVVNRPPVRDGDPAIRRPDL